MQEDENAVQIAPGNKFAVLAIPSSDIGPCPRLMVDLGAGFAASIALPAGALDTWKESIGTLHQREIADAQLFLWSIRPSARPNLLDDENKRLTRDVYKLYLGLLIAVDYFTAGRITAFTGGNEDGIARVRSLSWYPEARRMLGMHPPTLTVAHLMLASRLALALRRPSLRVSHRIVRALRAFRQASESAEIDLRLHQFVRCLEGIVIPPMRKSYVHFAERIVTLALGARRSALQELYTIRSGIEHLHGPFDRMPKRPRGGRQLRLVQRCAQAEAIARYMLHSYLLHPEVWPAFSRRSQIEAFWDQPPSQIRKAWQTKIAFQRILSGFDIDDFNAALRR